MSKKATEKCSLVLMNGKVINVIAPEDNTEDVWNEMMDCLVAETVWDCGEGVDVEITFLGESLTCVDFKKVVGIRY